MQRYRFSLIELIVVIAIIILVTGLAVGRLGKFPTFATQEKVVRELESLFAKVGHAAAIRGKKVEIHYIPAERLFRMADMPESANDVWQGNRNYLAESYRSLQLPENVGVTFDGCEEGNDAVVFQCFPDGTATGPKMDLILNHEVVHVKFSPLTGQLLVQREEK